MIRRKIIALEEAQGWWSTDPSPEVAAQHQRRSGGLTLAPIVVRPAADLMKSSLGIEPQRRLVAFLHFEKDGADAQSGKPPQMQVEKPPAFLDAVVPFLTAS